MKGVQDALQIIQVRTALYNLQCEERWQCINAPAGTMGGGGIVIRLDGQLP
jgi:hypothetical protein